MDRIRLRVRFDFAAESKPGKLFFGSRNTAENAEEIRQQKVTLLKNIPVQGINIEDIDMGHEIYSIIDDITNKSTYYAPVSILFTADTLDNAVKYTMKEGFRTIEIIDPKEIKLSQIETIRLIQNVNEEMLNYKNILERRMDNWK